jgi:hypothetical protein
VATATAQSSLGTRKTPNTFEHPTAIASSVLELARPVNWVQLRQHLVLSLTWAAIAFVVTIALGVFIRVGPELAPPVLYVPVVGLLCAAVVFVVAVMTTAAAATQAVVHYRLRLSSTKAEVHEAQEELETMRNQNNGLVQFLGDLIESPTQQRDTLIHEKREYIRSLTHAG